MEKIRVCVLSLSASRVAGGLFFSVSSLSKKLSADDRFDLEVWSVEDPRTSNDLYQWEGVKLRVFPRTFKGKFGVSIDMLRAAMNERFDVVHLHGVWNFMSLVARVFQSRGSKIVISPRGMYDKWILARSAFVKKCFLALIEKRLIDKSLFIHALTEMEENSVRVLGGKRVLVIPNGVDPIYEVGKKELSRGSDDLKSLVYVGRLHEKKGLLEFIRAWSSVDDDARKNWKLDIYGWGGSDYVQALNDVVTECDLSATVSINSEVYGEEKAAVLCTADAFVLPTKSEGLPMAVLEAWAYGLPCLMTAEANLPVGFQVGAARELSNDVSKWSTEIALFFAEYPDTCGAMRKSAQDLVASQFDWRLIAKRIGDAYVGECSV